MCWSSHHSDRENWSDEERRESTRRADPVVTPDHLRVSDAEREAVIAQLRQHVGEGRLTLDEFETRVEDVTRARTGAELRVVLRDLPPLRERTAHRERRRAGVPPVLVLAGILAVVSIAVGHLVIWPLFIFAFCGFGRRRHWHDRDERADPVTVT